MTSSCVHVSNILCEQVCPALSREEQQSREIKADMVRRMVAGAAGSERERLLAINQIMARQVVKKRNEMTGKNYI